MSSIKSPPVIKISVFQCATLFCAAGLVAGIWGWTSAWSLLLGGMISIIPNAYFAYRAFRESGARVMEKVVRDFYLAELGKLVLAGAGFALVFSKVETLEAAFLFIGFMGIHVSGMVALFRLLLRYRQQT